MLKLRHFLSSLFICSAILVSSAFPQSTLTQIRDTVTDPDGTPFNGIVVITWNGSGYPSGSNVAPRSTSAGIYNGVLSVLLVPTTTASASSYYSAVYTSNDGLVTWTEDWDVPPSTTALTLSQVRVSSSEGLGSSSSTGSGSSGSGGSGSGASGGSGSGGSTGNSGSGGSGTVSLPISIDDVTDLSSDLEGINNTLTTLQATDNSITATTNNLSANVTGLDTTVGSIQTTVSGLTSTVNTLNTTVSSLSSSQTSTANSLAGLTTTVNGIGTTVSGLSSTVAGLSSTLTTLSGAVNGQGTTISSLSAAQSSLSSQVSGISTTVTSLNTTVNGLSTSVTALNTSVASLTSTVNALNNGGSPALVNADTVAGTANGANATFTLTQTPSPVASLQLFRNGILESNGVDYTISGNTVTFASGSIPQSTDTMTAFYQIAGTGAAVTFVYAEAPGGTINGTNATFTLANAPNPGLSLRLYKNGMLMLQNGDYSLSGKTITFTSGVIPQTGDLLAAYYTH